MREQYKFNKENFRPLLGKFISSIVCTEDFRFQNGATVQYQPYYNRFEGIQNLVFWYYLEEDHYSLKLYSVDNGRFISQNKETHYGIRSIGLTHNQDLNFRKTGSIYLKPSGTFVISANRERIVSIKFYQEVQESMIEETKNSYLPSLRDNSKFPDRIVMEGEDLYIVIRAEEDYYQNLFLMLNIGYKSKTEEDYCTSFTEPNSVKCIKLDEISIND